MKLRNTILIGAAVGMVAMIQTAQAAFTDTLADLVAHNGSLTIGDKTFSNFGFNDSLDAGPSLGAQAAGLTVTALSYGGGVYGLDFGGGLIVDNSGATTGNLLGDVKLSYTVTVNNPAQPIYMIDQNYTGNGLPLAGNQITIGETVKTPALVTVGNSTLTLQPVDLSDPFAEAGDNLMIVPPQLKLLVVKDIFISAAHGQFVGLSDVEQSFHEVVPEPTTMIAGALLLLPFGASTLRILRRNRMV